jgi:hypothetical protein
MADVRAMPPEALNVLVARLLGWRVDRAETDYDDDTWVVIDPAHPDDRWMFVHAETESVAWQEVASRTAVDEFGGWINEDDQLPNYAGDLNAAWALWGDVIGLQIERLKNLCVAPFVVVTYEYKPGMVVREFDHDANPARALTLAWVAWKMEAE